MTWRALGDESSADDWIDAQAAAIVIGEFVNLVRGTLKKG